MSANNWTTCPRCQHKAAMARKLALAKVQKLYGKVPLEEYEQKQAKAEAMPEGANEETLREDYQLGLRGGTFEIQYRAFCTQCGLEYRFDHSVDVEI